MSSKMAIKKKFNGNFDNNDTFIKKKKEFNGNFDNILSSVTL